MCDQAHVITLRQPSPEYLILDLCGFLGNTFERAVEVTANHLHNNPTRLIVLNFSSVPGMDGTGLKYLLVFCTLMRKMNRKLAAFGVNEELRRVFTLMRLENLLRTCEDEYQALRLGG